MDKYIKRLYDTYNGREIEDDGPVVSNDFKKFAAFMKRQLKGSAENRGFQLHSFMKGHYDVCGFFEKDGKFVYFSFNEPRWSAIDFSRSDAYCGFLYRTAAHAKDYTGGINNFAALPDLMDCVEHLLEQQCVA